MFLEKITTLAFKGEQLRFSSSMRTALKYPLLALGDLPEPSLSSLSPLSK